MFIQFPLGIGGVLNSGGWQIVMFIQYPIGFKETEGGPIWFAVCDENKQQQQPAGLTRMPNGIKIR
jgi:hypothetical protein